MTNELYELPFILIAQYGSFHSRLLSWRNMVVVIPAQAGIHPLSWQLA
ncbi:hypothetical protein [Legionella beliardensis]|nr:hypothetical protein [Legionella beliardensis]